MRVFVTGATGFIGAALIPELTAAGHSVLGLARSDAGAEILARAGVQTHRGSTEDLDSLRRGAAAADAVIHLAFNHDFTRFEANSEVDRRAIEAIGSELAGSGRPFIVTSGTAAAATPGRLTTEDDPANAPMPRIASEHAALALAARGVRVGVMRLSQVHDPMKQGLITFLVAVAREKGVSAYIGDGQNRWPAVHIGDTVRLYRLVLENGEPGIRHHAVAEEGVAMRDIAEAVGRGLKLPVTAIPAEAAAEHFGALAMFAGADMPASSALTRQRLGWQPEGPGLMTDLAQGRF